MRNFTVITISLLVALMLTLMPMPAWAVWARPAWVLMVLLFWTLTLPYQVNVGVAWLTGIVLDLMMGTILGEHALALMLIVYAANKLHLRINMYSILQQCFCVLLFVFLYQFIIFCTQGFIGNLPNSQLYWLPSLTSMLLWPWLSILLRDFASWYRVTVAE